MTDLHTLEADLTELQRLYEVWHAPIVQMEQETWRKRHAGVYTEADQVRDIEAIYRQQLVLYNPAQAESAVREALLAAYVDGDDADRAAMRMMVARLGRAPYMLMDYILMCAECLETPNDGWILRSGLVAAAIENYNNDFRDTGYVLSELAIAAVKAGIDIEPHAKAVAEMCSPEATMPGHFFMRKTISNFHIFAPTAKHVFEE